MGQNFDTIHLYVAHRVLPLKSSVLISNLLNGKALNWNLQISTLLTPIYADLKGLMQHG